MEIMQDNQEKPSIGMCIVCFLFPIVGIIYYIVKHKQEPVLCNAYIKWSAIALILRVVFVVILNIINILLYGYCATWIFRIGEIIFNAISTSL